MRELRFAALLHDFGKVAVREELLIKAKKLPPHLCERVEARFGLIRRTMEAEYHRKSVETLLREDSKRQIDPAVAAEFQEALEELEKFRIAVGAANEPSIEAVRPTIELADIAKRTFERHDGSVHPYLTTDELRFLQLSTGTLDACEREAVEGHVDATFRFLVGIPWTDDLKNLTTYAYGHHEKLDGSGYPRKLRGEEIPIQTRIMTIADMFDALTASDRPYKAAVDAINTALTTFNQKMQAAGTAAGAVSEKMTHLTSISPALQKALEKAYNAKTVDDYTAALAGVNGILDDQAAKQQELDSTLQKYGLDWTELGTEARGAKMNELAQGLIKDFNTLRAGGVDVNHEMAAMGPKLNDFVRQAQKAGVEVPSDMKTVLQSVLDDHYFFEVHAAFAPNIRIAAPFTVACASCCGIRTRRSTWSS
jgi:hypothetical protein